MKGDKLSKYENALQLTFLANNRRTTITVHSLISADWGFFFKGTNEQKSLKKLDFKMRHRPGSCIGEMTTLSFLKGFIKYPFGFSCGLTIIDPWRF